ncbi:syntaxin-8 isoform X6 [Parasteatoda tepidariorum]|uniref:syntaxin-8 isoform X6 n=1 Tax=Parasteatoda tepidariorum TaxID=114398 RepID=UPI0039BD35D0
MSMDEGEFERRERLIDGLNNKNTQINDAFSGREEGGNRQALLGAEMVTASTNVWGMEEDERTRDLSFNEIKEQQLMAIQEIIDDIVEHADNTRERLIKETRHVAIVDRKSGECCYWVIIVLLFIAIVVIAVIPS